MTPGAVVYQPKGSMCLACAYKNQDCSALHFHAMPVIGTFMDVQIVKCTAFTKA